MDKKFLQLYRQNAPDYSNWMQIIVDTETGVNYLINRFGTCPRYNSKGEIMVSSKQDVDLIIAQNEEKKPKFI